MHVKSRSGRVFRIPSDEQDTRIRDGIAADPDACELSDEQLGQLRPVRRSTSEASKEAISIPLSSEVLDYFKASGPGWQTRIDSVLREWIKTHPAV